MTGPLLVELLLLSFLLLLFLILHFLLISKSLKLLLELLIKLLQVQLLVAIDLLVVLSYIEVEVDFDLFLGFWLNTTIVFLPTAITRILYIWCFWFIYLLVHAPCFFSLLQLLLVPYYTFTRPMLMMLFLHNLRNYLKLQNDYKGKLLTLII
jgi:hypothetical protein